MRGTCSTAFQAAPRRHRAIYRFKVLLDSTYLLLTFGVEVEGLAEEHIARLRECAVRGEALLPLGVVGLSHREDMLRKLW